MSVCTALSSFSSPRLQYFKESPLSRPDQVFTRPAPARLFPALVFRAPPPLPPPQARRPSVVVPVVLLCSASGAVYCVNQVLAHPPPSVYTRGSGGAPISPPRGERPSSAAGSLPQGLTRSPSTRPGRERTENGRRTDVEGPGSHAETRATWPRSSLHLALLPYLSSPCVSALDLGPCRGHCPVPLCGNVLSYFFLLSESLVLKVWLRYLYFYERSFPGFQNEPLITVPHTVLDCGLRFAVFSF